MSRDLNLSVNYGSPGWPPGSMKSRCKRPGASKLGSGEGQEEVGEAGESAVGEEGKGQGYRPSVAW